MKKKVIYSNILLLLLLLGFCGTSFAVTWEDFVEYGHEILDYEYVGYSDLSQGLPLLFTYQDNIETYLGDLDSYNGFCYISAWNASNRSYYYLVYGINYTSNTSISCSSTSVSISNCSWKKLDSYSSFTQPTVSNSTGNFNLSGTINRLYFLVDNTWVTNWYNWVGNNRYNGVVQRLNTINSDNTILFDSLLGKYWFTDNYSWQLYSGDSFVTNLIDYDNNISENYDNLGFQLIAENQDLITTNYNYNVRLFVNDTLKYKSNNYTIYNNYINNGSNSSNIGNITNSSGDVTGNINLDEINNNLITIIDILSGDIVTAVDNQGNIITGSLSQLQQSINDIKNGLFGGSGDSGEGILGGTTLESGEEPTIEDLPTIEVEDPSNDFFTWLLQEIEKILNDNTDVTLTIPIYKTNYYIRSDVFKLTIEPLRTFIQAGWWFIVGVPFLKYIRRSVEKLKGGEIPASDDKSDLLGNIL